MHFVQAHHDEANQSQGFTLLELITVIAIIAGILALVPRVIASYPSIEFRAAGLRLAETLRQTRADAVRTGRVTHVTLDIIRHSYTASGKPILFLPDIIRFAPSRKESSGVGDDASQYSFFPDGSATGGTITLQNDRRRMTISIDWLTGRVQLVD